MERILLVHDHAAAHLEQLRHRFPEVEAAVCAEPASLPAVLAAFRPTIAYSCKTEGMPGPAHRPLLDCPSLAWLHVGGSGYDHLDGWEMRPFIMTNSRGVLAPFLAEVAVAAMASLCFGLPRYLRQQQARLWRKNNDWRPFAGRSLLVVGTGAIGREVARRARAFGVRVVGLNRVPRPLPEFDEVRSLSDLLPSLVEADIVSLHLRLVPETRRLIDARALAAMRPGSLLVNTARGGLVDESALAVALASGRLGGAYLDVFETEPLPSASPLWHLDNVILSPHCADNVAGWEERLAEFFTENLARRLRGLPLLNRVSADGTASSMEPPQR